ncbi:putative protein kinase RLK-Pelle-CrRLK1L-1 family transcription factor bHLH family [Helianthus annuus]|uniref:Putative myc-type, basic helix-loop-helix (BHLH) domain-containing protein n=1 Tax=Helianthus annuus TaxID=4232 RepID=A0A251U320_HELAN|nr:probable receptor-like protein kinase At5g38990 [Helianthus annuus]KAF5793910.1 putative protein kinase RLK-Pelle-CrRLK1L-1 family transcription factor bHLH family [Helianthus annuus]KAJ0552219.1 putative protein kinase RLK-Pelle-CrRLK1L-1 family transcription factor bHLH family [Helianthus annuus]
MSSIEDVKHLQIPLQELSDATNAFSEANFLARGGFGMVYKGVSAKHGNIAIKILDPGLGQGDKEFRTEIALLSVYKHENIVSLLGFCDEDGKKILVYKYESNGSLDKHLERKDLTWIQRLQICLDAARGLQYLHDDVEPHRRILHRDVKSSNILLDENWKAKVSDFGLSKMGPTNTQSTYLVTRVCGTPGYIDPDYLNTGFLTQKSDVYSFGVVLFEVLCGRLSRVTKYNDKREYLINLVKIHRGRKTLDEIIDSNIRKQIKKASLVTFSSIAYQCLKSGNERPTMKKVVKQLQKALDEQLLDGDGKRLKTLALENENPESKPKVERSTSKKTKNSVKLPEPPKQDYIHVRARRGQATGSHSQAERVRREKIEERMKILQDLVPGGNKVTGKAPLLDETINYIQSLQQQVEFGQQSFDMVEVSFASQPTREYSNGSSLEWLRMKIGGIAERTTIFHQWQ